MSSAAASSHGDAAESHEDAGVANYRKNSSLLLLFEWMYRVVIAKVVGRFEGGRKRGGLGEQFVERCW
jgi:hypothetical protein